MSCSSWGLLDYLADIPDPRIERCRAHRLIDILMIAVCGALCGADNFCGDCRVWPHQSRLA